MEEWKVLKKEEIELNDQGDFLEISVKEHPISKEELYGISKGWKNKEGVKKYKSNIIVSKEISKKLALILQKL